ncbi:hypothetical protein EB155_14425, partial [archaeon]|nr:hypothetical protein [archaeon]NDB56771.1 hypothetical protein [archaeon]NDB81052.1 hypothetical protein [archaeon]NDF28587.1 hypothetical protein [archaeon]
MGFLDWLFGRDRKKDDIGDSKELEAIATLKKQLNNMEIKGNKLQRQVGEQKDLAKNMLKIGNKIGAREALVRSNVYLQKYNQLSNSRLNLQTLIDNISDATDAKELVSAMKIGNQVVSEMISEVETEDLEKTMIEMEENRDRVDIMNETLADTTAIETNMSMEFTEGIDEQLAALEMEISGELPDIK